MEGTPKSVTADGSGNYSITVLTGWSGTVTPYKSGYTFTPIDRSYSNVQSNQTAQNYVAQVCTGCADISVDIGGDLKGSYTAPPGSSLRINYAGVDNGPVKVVSPNGTKLISAIRDSWWDGTKWSSFSQLMGLPENLLSDTYYFPAYNNVSLDEQLRFGNVDTAETDVTVTIGGVAYGPYHLWPPGTPDPSTHPSALRFNYAGVDTGPVVVHSSGGVKIIAALRDSWWDGTTWSSFIQTMGLPGELVSDTYLFPAYNNVSLDEQLRFGNVDTAETDVTVTIGGVAYGPYHLWPPGTPDPITHPSALRFNYAGVDTGPVVVHSSGGVKIIAALRDSWWDGTKWSDFSQLMGLPMSSSIRHLSFPCLQ